ncbi:S-adenosyl-L-methionine-dependent methyltransferases superfamily protein [Arabidopsis thaliana]|uniref:carnosine N-methyltransferase n=1 Tax=Arabidopsis thaliana TaxID=3702 RepID=F4IST2_ARATH|nr:S-adenosyl-L-methionine-dependent methyltransferases superfamily protein [Arabidopsis thaliana]AEC08645.1 S-adenosyl-L-methionine-dependent methyltransferases superfamily protein [Arabidopsis thaliana]|eukprot:NP_001154543.1 S-adenosyl-L-methionine-dependent methyltransferases superfamily protein [Arabidopsis thaliana]
MVSPSEMTETAPAIMTTESERIESSRELVDNEEEEKIRRQKKLEEALEAKSLRRIISAYLNYPEASEEDLKRWERSYRKLSPAHKALVPHYPMKFQRLRRCISANSYFIFNMLQAFEPPIDLSQELDGCEDSNLDCAPHERYTLDERHDSSCQPALTNSCTYKEESKHIRDPITGVSIEELQRKEAHDHSPKDDSADTRINDKTCDCHEGQLNHDHGSVSFSSHDWLDSSLQTHVPLVDVDKRETKIIMCHVRTYSQSLLVPLGSLVSYEGWFAHVALHGEVNPVELKCTFLHVRCIIRNIVRDWAAEGQRERDQCYKPILEELDSLFPDRLKESTCCIHSPYKVDYMICSTPPACLVPGAGLGRLALEISCLGFISQGNEFSYYMMICSSFILNYTQVPGEWTIYPWIHSNCNSLSDNDQLRPIAIPDIHPASAGITEGFSMCGGDFVEVYNESSHAGMWDAVVTCFFIDTAHNVIEYIQTISKILKDGGVWINLGPLLYHFADTYGHENEMSIELSLEDVKRVASHFGFVIEKERTIETTYTTNPRAMMQNRYYTAFWTMRKKCAITTT